MFIESIKLDNFRNYETLSLDLCSGTNLFYGDNAQGKTNILESVYLCGTTRSQKGSRDREMIRFDAEEAHIRMMLRKKDIPCRIDVHLKKNRSKGIAVNGVPIRRASELLGIGNFVFFSPDDLNIIKNGPSERRKFIDMELCQLDPYYLMVLTNYNRALLQKNKLLKDVFFRPDLKDTFDLWDQQLAQYGREVISRRDRFIEKMNPIVRDIHRSLSGGTEEIRLLYEPDASGEDLERLLFESRDRDIRMKSSTTGPHRDDLSFQIDGIDVRKYGSQGQQRTAALSLKLAEIILVEEMSSDRPVLLLDDVLSELDSKRQHFLLNCIHDVQTLMTCTGVDDYIKNNFQIDRLFQVVNGNVSIQTGGK